MSAWLLDIEGNWHEANGDIEIRTIDFITRLQTIKGEQSFKCVVYLFSNIIIYTLICVYFIKHILFLNFSYFLIIKQRNKKDLYDS